VSLIFVLLVFIYCQFKKPPISSLDLTEKEDQKSRVHILVFGFFLEGGTQGAQSRTPYISRNPSMIPTLKRQPISGFRSQTNVRIV